MLQEPVEMDMSLPQNMKETSPDDHFARLPNDILLSILGRTDDLKYLCQCSLVSKRFATTIYRIENVSLTLPSTMPVQHIHKLYHQISDSNSEEEIPGLIRSSPIQTLKFSLFLQNFKELKSINLEFICPRVHPHSSLLKWKAKYRNNEGGVESIVSIAATSVSTMTNENESDEEHVGENIPTHFSYAHSNDGSFLPMKCCKQWLFVLCLLVKTQHSLKSVTVTDTHKHGKLVLKDAQIVELRKNLIFGGLNFPKTLMSKMFWSPKLHLPLSGCMLREVSFVIIRFTAKSDNPMTWEYEGEDMVLAEALSEIRKTFKDLFVDFFCRR